VKRIILLLLLLLTPNISLGQTIIQTRDIKQASECKLFISSNTPVVKDVAMGKIITTYNAVISTAKVKTGKYSIYFDGSGDYLAITNTADFNFSSTDFTIDMWCNFTALPANFTGIFVLDGISSNGYKPLSICTNNTSIFWGIANATMNGWADSATITHGMTTAIWYHLAFVKNGSNLSVYKNGINISSINNVDNIQNYSQTVSTVFVHYNGSTTYYLNGYLTDLRVIKGKAIWTTDFTPPRRSGSY